MDPGLPTSHITPQGHLDLSSLPPIFISSTHFDDPDLHDLEDQLLEVGGNLTYDIAEATIILSKAERKRRIEFDFRVKGLFVEQVIPVKEEPLVEEEIATRPAKRRRVDNVEALGQSEGKAIVIGDDDSTASEAEAEPRPEECSQAQPEPFLRHSNTSQGHESSGRSAPTAGGESITEKWGDTVTVVRVKWFEDCVKAGTLLPLKSYITYEGRAVERPQPAEQPSTPGSILERAKTDAPARVKSTHGYRAQSHRQSGQGTLSASFSHSGGASTDKHRYAHLLQETTSEHEGNISSDLPEMPNWVKAGVRYACQRVTPPNSPNDGFIAQLKKIKLARLLTNDEIGVRAYSTSIASLAAYPYRISNPREIILLPGCDVKIANLYIEYLNTGKVQPAEEAEASEEMKILRLFYEIWGVGATTAREFYYDKGWRDLDDIVEFGWSTLSRVQQIGVKYYSEFLSPIPRPEVEDIARIITAHAVKVRDSQVQTLLVGGYRRGKEACGDVDIIVSHPDESETLGIVTDIVASLEKEGWITHTLLLSLTSSNRGQQTLPFITGSGGHGFDTLDKALVVWQDPHWSTEKEDLMSNPKPKNPNIHRRVDIIVSPWRTIGCAVAGWSGGTTFQRDLRRYAKSDKGWKFDSSGVRDRGSGRVVDVEGYGDESTRAKTMEEAEKRVFEAFGLEYREPWERCTG